MRARLYFVCGLAALMPTATRAARPAEAILEDRAAAAAEIRDLERRARSLDEQAALRRERLRRRVRALYKLSSGGTLRLVADAGSREAMALRYQAARRIVARDLDELQAVREEARTIDEDQARRSAQLARALELERQMSRVDDALPEGLAALAGQLARPVAGVVVGGFGAYRDPELRLELARRGIELRSRAGEPVGAVAAGWVRWVGEVPGLGRGVMVDHGGQYLTLTARLGKIAVETRAAIAAGARLGEAAGNAIYLELSQAGTPFDPAPWLAPAAPAP